MHKSVVLSCIHISRRFLGNNIVGLIPLWFRANYLLFSCFLMTVVPFIHNEWLHYRKYRVSLTGAHLWHLIRTFLALLQKHPHAPWISQNTNQTTGLSTGELYLSSYRQLNVDKWPKKSHRNAKIAGNTKKTSKAFGEMKLKFLKFPIQWKTILFCFFQFLADTKICCMLTLGPRPIPGS
jgi:hypothetical protein